MKLGLVCGNDIREEVVARLHAIGLDVFRQADLYVVEDGWHDSLTPCIVFHRDHLDELCDVLRLFASRAETSKIVGLRDEEYYVLSQDHILYFEAVDSHLLCHTADGVYRMKERLFQLEERLPGDRFIKVNRSYVVNIDNVSKIIPWFHRRLLLKFNDSKKEVEVSKNYVAAFKAFLGMR
ncbi:LytTR family DNA-binding domain-containing protein [Marinicrinis sediminis]|uniref:LytTR family DNA-binding domain-containing protein n=1 Tax=Marinicrinis sediminis TaxID=1652465 RepID=A0ABW5RDH6_9BACL